MSSASVNSQDTDHAARGDAKNGSRHANSMNMKMRGYDYAGTLCATQASQASLP